MTAGAKRKFAINLLLIASLVSVMPMPNLVLVYSGNEQEEDPHFFVIILKMTFICLIIMENVDL